ncbi:MAG: hypothetical protein V1895_02935, partial [Parcubacteria group bacterium]
MACLTAVVLTIILLVTRNGEATSAHEPAFFHLTPAQWREASLELKRLIQTHPDPDIHDALYQLIENKIVWLNFQELEEGTNKMATITLMTPEGASEEVPTFAFVYPDLMSSAIQDKAKQLVISHEYNHLTKLLNGSLDKQNFERVTPEQIAVLSEEHLKSVVIDE